MIAMPRSIASIRKPAFLAIISIASVGAVFLGFMSGYLESSRQHRSLRDSYLSSPSRIVENVYKERRRISAVVEEPPLIADGLDPSQSRDHEAEQDQWNKDRHAEEVRRAEIEGQLRREVARLQLTEQGTWMLRSRDIREFENSRSAEANRISEQAREAQRAVDADANKGRNDLKDQADNLRQYLSAVQARFNTPERIAYGASTAITFILETQGKGTGQELIKGFMGPEKTAEVLVGAEAQALLTGPTDLVEIKPRGPLELQRKAVSEIAPVQWTWDVKGIGIGTAVLQIELNAFVNKDKSSAPLQVKTFQQSIPIEISLTDRALKFMTELNPIWASGATIVTAIGGLLAYFGLKPGKRAVEGGNSNPKIASTFRLTGGRSKRPSVYGRRRI